MSEKLIETIRTRKIEVERQLETIYHKIELYQEMKHRMEELKQERELELAELNNMIDDIKRTDEQ